MLEEVTRLESRFDADGPGTECDPRRKAHRGGDGQQGCDPRAVGQQRQARHQGGCGRQQDQTRDQAERRAERDRRQREPAEARNDLTEKLPASGRRLRAGGCGRRGGDADHRQEHVEQRMGVVAIPQLVSAHQQVEAEGIESRNGDAGRAQRRARPQLGRPGAPGKKT